MTEPLRPTAREAPGAVARSWGVYRDYLALGHDVREGPGCRGVRCDEAPSIYDANHVQAVAADTPEAIQEMLAFQEELLGDRPHRQVMTDPDTPPGVAAELALAGYRASPTLQMLLETELLGKAPIESDIRPVYSEEDWSRLHRLFRADHVESDAKAMEAGRSKEPVYSERVTAEMLVTKRKKCASQDQEASALRFFLAWEGGEAVAFFSAWPGHHGVGMVEDLFTLPSHRGRGIARALIHHCVADARHRGAGPVLIGAAPDDTPRHAYAAMGFRPVCLTYAWNRAPVPDASGERPRAVR